MGATTFRKKLKNIGIENIVVKNYRIEDVPKESDVIVVHKDLVDRTKKTHPNIRIVALNNYLQDPAIDELVTEVSNAINN